MEQEIDAIINHLVRTRQRFRAIAEFSSSPGIYAVFCGRRKLPHIDDDIKPDEILYIGKTESSQLSRDAKTHFANGRTGSSTLRRTFGALLREELGLIPIPRSATDAARGKRSHYKFTDESEAKLTKWMADNLLLSFFEFSADRRALEDLETQLIQRLVPKLNLDKNPGNPCKGTVTGERHRTARLAHGASRSTSRSRTEPTAATSGIRGDGQYTELWKRVCSNLEQRLERGAGEVTVQLDAHEFEAAGNRKKYAFNLEFQDGRVSNNTKGSAVARHLASTLIESPAIMEKVGSGHWKFRLDSDFCFHVTKLR